MKIKIRKGDNVFVLAGKDRGKTGIVQKVLVEKHKVVVAGVQVVKCFNKKKMMAGGPTSKEMPIDISNVAHLDPKELKPTKVKIAIQDNEKVLVAKRSDAVIRKIVKSEEKK